VDPEGLAGQCWTEEDTKRANAEALARERAFGDPDNKPWDKFMKTPAWAMMKGAYKGYRVGKKVAGPVGAVVGPGFGMINGMQNYKK